MAQKKSVFTSAIEDVKEVIEMAKMQISLGLLPTNDVSRLVKLIAQIQTHPEFNPADPLTKTTLHDFKVMKREFDKAEKHHAKREQHKEEKLDAKKTKKIDTMQKMLEDYVVSLEKISSDSKKDSPRAMGDSLLGTLKEVTRSLRSADSNEDKVAELRNADARISTALAQSQTQSKKPILGFFASHEKVALGKVMEKIQAEQPAWKSLLKEVDVVKFKFQK